MEEVSLILLKPDFLKGLENRKKRLLDARRVLINMIDFCDLTIIQEDYIDIDRETLLGYQSGMRNKKKKNYMDFSSYSLKDFEPWQRKILKFQTGKYLKAKKHLMIVLKGRDSIKKCLDIKKLIREEFISKKTKSKYINLIHSEDSEKEALNTIRLFKQKIVAGKSKKYFINQK